MINCLGKMTASAGFMSLREAADKVRGLDGWPYE